MKKLLLFVALCSPLTTQARELAKPRLHTIKKARKGRYDLKIVYPQWRAKTPTVKAANYFWRSFAYKSWFRVTARAKEQFADTPTDWKPAGPSYYYLTPKVSVAQSDLISGYWFADFYDSGIHPNSETFAMNIGFVNGAPKQLSIYDICLPGKTRAVAEKVWQRLRRIEWATWVQIGEVKADSPVLTKEWVATPTGLLFIFDPYVASSYSAGEIRVKIPYSELKTEIDPNGPLKPLL